MNFPGQPDPFRIVVWDGSKDIQAIVALQDQPNTFTNKSYFLDEVHFENATISGLPIGTSSGQEAGITIDGNGSLVTSGINKGQRQFQFPVNILSWTLIADVVGSVQMDIQKSSYAAYPTFNSIVASAPPILSSAQKNTSSTLTGWTTAIANGDILRFDINSIAAIKKLTLSLKIQ